MVGARRSKRCRYVTAGYSGTDELYIQRDPAGSARDNLRDSNRRGYGAESPEPPIQYRVTRKKSKPLGFTDRLLAEVRRDKLCAAFCGFLLVVLIFLSMVYATKLSSHAMLERELSMYLTETASLEQENAYLQKRLDAARDGGRIRSIAQNELGMLRRERAEKEEIYIQIPDTSDAADSAAEGEVHMELLDVLLGLLHRLHIGE